MPENKKKYYAFISYSHQDSKWGDWLHKALESYKVPKAIRGKPNRSGTVPEKLFPIFRDREELPTATDLGAVISNAIRDSAYLIVICSPRSAKSMWVNQEIINFKKLGRENRVLAIIVDGEPNGADKPGLEDTECFPEALKYVVGENGELTGERTEPIAADARQGKDGKNNALIKLLSGLLGVNYDDLKQREKRRQRKLRITYSLVVILFMAVGMSYWQYAQNLEQQRLISESLTLAADSNLALKQGKSKQAVKLALQALPHNLEPPQRPYVAEAETALSQALYQHKERYSLQAHQGKVIRTTMSPDGRYLFTAAENGKIKQWENANHKLVQTFSKHKAPVINIQHHPDREILVSRDDDGRVLIWDLKTGKSTAEFFQYGSQYDNNISWDSSGRYVFVNQVVRDLDRNQNLDLNFSEAIKKYSEDNHGNEGIVLPIKGTSMALFAAKRKLIFVDLKQKRQMGEAFIPESVEPYLGDLKRIELVDNGHKFLGIFNDGKSFLFDSKSYQFLKKLDFRLDHLLSVSWNDNKLLYFHNYNFWLYDTVKFSSKKLNENFSDYVVSDGVKLLNDSKKFVILQKSSSIDIVDLGSGQVVYTLDSGFEEADTLNVFNSVKAIQHVSINNDINQLNMGLADGRVKTFDLSEINNRKSYSLSGQVKSLRHSRDGKYYAAFLESKKLILIDIDNVQSKIIFDSLEIDDMKFARQGKSLLVLANNKLHLIDVSAAWKKRNEVKVLKPFPAGVTLADKISLSVSNEKVAVYSKNGEQRVYDLNKDKWLSTQDSSGVKSIKSLAGDYLVNSSRIELSLLDKREKIIKQVFIDNKSLHNIYRNSFKFNSDMSRGVWVDKAGLFEYRDFSANKTIATNAVNMLEYISIDMVQDGGSALVANGNELVIYTDQDTKSSQLLKPQYDDAAVFVHASFESDPYRITVVERVFKNNVMQNIIYSYDLNDHKILWKSQNIEGELVPINSTINSVALRTDTDLYVYQSNRQQLQQSGKVLSDNVKNMVQIGPFNKQIITYDNGFLARWNIGGNKPVWKIKNNSQKNILFSKDGKYFVDIYNSSYSNSSRVAVFSSETGMQVAANQNNRGIVYGFDHNNNVLSWQDGYALCLWDWKQQPTFVNGHNTADVKQCKKHIFNNAHVYMIDDKHVVLNYVDVYDVVDARNLSIKNSFICESLGTLFPVKNNSESISCINKHTGYQMFDVNKNKLEWPFSDKLKIKYIEQSDNGRYLAALDNDYILYSVDIQSDLLPARLLESPDMVSFKIDDTGRYISVLKRDWSVELWDINLKSLIYSGQLPENIVSYLGGAVMFLSNTKQIVLVFSSGDVYVTGPGITQFSFKIDALRDYRSVKINLKKKRLVQVNYEGIHLWNLESGEKISSHSLSDFYGVPHSITFNQDINIFSVVAGKFFVFDVKSGQLLLSVGKITSSVFSSSQQFVALGKSSMLDQGKLEIWDLITLKKVSQISLSSIDDFYVFSPDEKSILVVTSKGFVKRWLFNSAEAALIEISHINLRSVPEEIDKDWIVMRSSQWQRNAVVLKSSQTGETVHSISSFFDNSYWSLAKEKDDFKLSVDGRFMLVRKNKFSLGVIDLKTYSESITIDGLTGEIDSYVFLDSQSVVTMTVNGTIQIWSLADGAEVLRFSDRENNQKISQYSGLSLSANKNIASYFDGVLSIWRADRRQKSGSITLRDETLGAQINTAGTEVTLIGRSGQVSVIPLQPQGQMLIDKARKKVGYESL